LGGGGGEVVVVVGDPALVVVAGRAAELDEHLRVEEGVAGGQAQELAAHGIQAAFEGAEVALDQAGEAPAELFLHLGVGLVLRGGGVRLGGLEAEKVFPAHGGVVEGHHV
jgi:hypothetical protein